MHILLTGATGFIGRKLIQILLQEDYEVTVVSRDPVSAAQTLPTEVKIISWDNQGLMEALASTTAVVNLAGEPITGKRWTSSKKVSIMNSRLLAAQRLASALRSRGNENIVYLQASAIGYYGNTDEKLCMESTPSGSGFLAEVCRKWESQVPEIEKHQKRVVSLRIGLVLGSDGGFLPEVLKQSNRRTAGKMGNGQQWYSWIHIYDLIYAIMYLMNNDKASGPFNLVAPEPVRQKDLFKSVNSLNKRSLQFPAPAFLLKTVLGQMGKELILNGQKVSSSKLIRQGFIFKYIKVDDALQDLIRKQGE